jgi:hypothetical protein
MLLLKHDLANNWIIINFLYVAYRDVGNRIYWMVIGLIQMAVGMLIIMITENEKTK